MPVCSLCKKIFAPNYRGQNVRSSNVIKDLYFYKGRRSPHRFAAPGKLGDFYCGSKKNMTISKILVLCICADCAMKYCKKGSEKV